MRIFSSHTLTIATAFSLGAGLSAKLSGWRQWDSSGASPLIQAHFSPKGGCTEAIVSKIKAAQHSILVQAYSFTSAPIAQALVEAAHRGISVQVIVDKSQRTERYSSADFLVHAQIPTYVDTQHAIAHNKVMIIDDTIVLTGSFNFTKAAEGSNAENLLTIQDAKLGARYTENWKLHQQHSEKYTGR